MNKDSVKEFMDWAVTPDTVAVMVISKKPHDEFKSAMMNINGRYDMDAEIGPTTVKEYLAKHEWDGERLAVPQDLTPAQQIEWIRQQYK